MEDKDEEVVQDVVQRDEETENKKEEVYMVYRMRGLSWWFRRSRVCLRCRRPRFNPWMIPGEGNGYPLQCSCLENPRDRGIWGNMVHRVAKESDTT